MHNWFVYASLLWYGGQTHHSEQKMTMLFMYLLIRFRFRLGGPKRIFLSEYNQFLCSSNGQFGRAVWMTSLIQLPPSFDVGSRVAVCRAVPLESSPRCFGDFQEKTLECNDAARRAIDDVCNAGGFTQAWGAKGSDGFTAMTKIPVVILVKLVFGLPADKEDLVKSLIGAYPICMKPKLRTCMNVIVGRRPCGDGSFSLDKFSL